MADIYCYTCDDSKVDPELPRHLKHFGMDVVNQQKTDKSMTELVSHPNSGLDRYVLYI
jgi:ubiquitin carboxyl-terminal hydrolase 5/13